MGRLLFDGKPCAIVAWGAEEDCHRVVDIDMDDGTTKWSYWPSPRFTDEYPHYPVPTTIVIGPIPGDKLPHALRWLYVAHAFACGEREDQ